MSDLLMRLDTAVLYDSAGDGSVLPELAAARIRELETQLAEARADGWRKGIEAAATVNAGEAREILDHAAPASAVNALRWAEKRIRALPVPADLGVRHE